MRLALLIGACPSTFKESPKVRIPAGSWTIRLSGVADSKLSLKLNGSWVGDMYDKQMIVLVNPIEAMIEFTKRGSEKYISIFADGG